MTALILFISTFILVFALGIQSLNVNNGHRRAAMFTSFFIGSSQMVLFKLAPDASWLEAAGFLLGGPVGIYAAMCAHPLIVRKFKQKTPHENGPSNEKHSNTNTHGATDLRNIARHSDG